MTETTTTYGDEVVTYTREQLIDALVAEYEWYAHEGDDGGETLEEFKKKIEPLSIPELIEEAGVDEGDGGYTLEDFMHRYG